MWLTRVAEQLRRKQEREKHKRANEDIKIYNTSFASKINPFDNDTTIPRNDRFNRDKLRPAPLLMTENDVFDSILSHGKRFHVRKSDVRLVPDMVSEEIKDYYRAKLFASSLRSAKNKRDKC